MKEIQGNSKGKSSEEKAKDIASKEVLCKEI